VDGGEFHHISESGFDDSVTEWEAILGLGKKRREFVVNWLLDVPFFTLLLSVVSDFPFSSGVTCFPRVFRLE